MKHFVTLIFISIFALGMDAQPHASTDTLPPSTIIEDSVRVHMEEQKALLVSKMAKADLTYFVIRVADNMFGYTIFIDGQLYIEQKSIPAVSGNASFSKVEDAENVARLVMNKIKMGEMPPTISIDELKELKLVY